MSGYSEKLSPAWWLVAAIGLVLPASVLIFLPLSLTVGVTVGLVLWWGSVGLLWIASPRITLGPEGFRAGRAFIEPRDIGSVWTARGDDARAEKGTRLDARAWLVMVPWITPVVKIEITDRDDPTPYWLVSTRRPDALRDALLAASESTPDTPGRA